MTCIETAVSYYITYFYNYYVRFVFNWVSIHKLFQRRLCHPEEYFSIIQNEFTHHVAKPTVLEH